MRQTDKKNTAPSPSGFFAGEQIPAADALQQCIRCGMCLPACPTYSELRVERASPRGRAALIRMAADGKIELNPNFSDQMYLCLDCRACETACPSGVRIGYLIESARSQIEQNMPINPLVRLFREFIFGWLFQRHWRLELAALPLRLYQQSGLQRAARAVGILNLLPKPLRFMEELAPQNLKTPFRKTIPGDLAPHGEERARVGYFLGCMMSILFNKTTSASIDALRGSHCRVLTPKAIRCCGAPLMSDGYKHRAIEMMKFNIDLFDELNVDYIVSDCAACGAALKEYEEIFEDDEGYREKAKRFSAKAREITEFLGEWPHFHGTEMPEAPCQCGGDEDQCQPKTHPKNKTKTTVTYDAPCHLCHAQQVWKQPLKLIEQLPNATFVPLPESDRCCGSAGVYNITNHAMSMKILGQKMDRIEKTGADIVLTANPGCMLQLQYGVNKRGLKMQVKHVVEMLAPSGKSG